MKYCSDFRHDLEVGQCAERKLGEILGKKKIEVKYDRQASKTGNVFVEYMSRGKRSGIVTSEADYWAFFITDDNIIIIATDKLRHTFAVLTDQRPCVLGGDDNTSLGMLLRVSDLTI